jgi:hypothetical protein
MVNKFRFRALKRSFVVFSPLYCDPPSVRCLVEDINVLERGLARRTEVSVVNESIVPANEYSDGLEVAKETVDGDKEDDN